MINLKSLRLIVFHSICFLGVMFFAPFCSENGKVNSQQAAKQEGTNKLTLLEYQEAVFIIDNDAKFLIKAAEIQFENISLGRLAQQKGSTNEARDFGKMMETEHKNLLSEIRTLSQYKSISIPKTLTEDSKDLYDDLKKNTGFNFDKSYSKLMVQHHLEAINLYERALKEIEDPEIIGWVTKKLEVLRTHLNLAKEFKGKSDSLHH